MSCVARIVIPEVPHNATQRGNNRRDVFLVDDECQAYPTFRKQQSQTYGVKTLDYCVTTNRAHIAAGDKPWPLDLKARGKDLSARRRRNREKSS